MSRICIDHRRLAAVTVKNVYPVQCMEECTHSPSEAAASTTLDCSSGHWQIDVAEAGRDKSTFRSQVGLFRFIPMPFGLKNATAILQQAVGSILSQFK